MHGFSEQNAISFFVDATTNIFKKPDPLTKDLWLQMDGIAMKGYFCQWAFGKMTLAFQR